jgi:hypothetical protein
MTLRLLWRNLAETQGLLVVTMFTTIGVAIMPDLGIVMIVPLLMASARLQNKRFAQFELALPISARVWVFARMGADLLRMLVPLSVWTIAIATTSGDHSLALMSSVFPGKLFWTPPHVCELVLAILTATVLPYAIRADEVGSPPAHLVFGGWFAIAIVYVGIAVLVREPSALVATVIITAVAWLLIARSVPDNLVLMSRRVSGAEPVATGTADKRHVTNSDRLWIWPLVKASVPKPTMYFLAILLAAAALGSAPPLVYLYLLIGITLPQLQLMSAWMDPFPLSRRARLMFALLPTVFAGTVCMFIPFSAALPFGYFKRSLFYGAPSTYSEGESYFDSPTKAPLQYWSVARGGEVPVIRAAWGETSPAYTLKLPGLLLFNPYSSVKGSSERFIDWQFARVTTAVYGHPISRASYRSEGPLPPRVGGGFESKLLEAALTMTYGLYVVFMLGLANVRCMSHSKKARRFLSHVAAFAPPLFIMGVDIKYDYTTDIVMQLVRAACNHLVLQLHSNISLVGLLAIIPVAAMYSLVAWQFNRSDTVIPVVVNVAN